MKRAFFETLKVIGRGAFGEVSIPLNARDDDNVGCGLM
jgi:hypothetical protein